MNTTRGCSYISLFSSSVVIFYIDSCIILSSKGSVYNLCYLKQALNARCPSIFSSIAIELNVPRDAFSSIVIELTFVTLRHVFKKVDSVLFDMCAPETRTF